MGIPAELVVLVSARCIRARAQTWGSALVLVLVLRPGQCPRARARAHGALIFCPILAGAQPVLMSTSTKSALSAHF